MDARKSAPGSVWSCAQSLSLHGFNSLVWQICMLQLHSRPTLGIISDRLSGKAPGFGSVRRYCAAAQQARESGMGFLDGMIGGMVGAEMVTVVNGLIEKHGGVQGHCQPAAKPGPGLDRAVLD